MLPQGLHLDAKCGMGYTVKYIRISTDILWRDFHILVELELYMLYP